jgi:hypothetical protein
MCVTLSESRDLLAPDGVITLTEQPRLKRGSDDAAGRAGDRIASQLEQASFSDLQVNMRPMKPRAAVWVRGSVQAGHDGRHTGIGPYR